MLLDRDWEGDWVGDGLGVWEGELIGVGEAYDHLIDVSEPAPPRAQSRPGHKAHPHDQLQHHHGRLLASHKAGGGVQPGQSPRPGL